MSTRDRVSLPDSDTCDPARERRPSRGIPRYRAAALAGLGLLGASLTGCDIGYFEEGYFVVCVPGAEPDYAMPVALCLNKFLEGGVDPETDPVKACIQEWEEHGPPDFEPEVVANAFMPKQDGHYMTCDMSEHPYPVEELANHNAVTCDFVTDVVLTDNSTVTPSEDTLQPFDVCDPGTWNGVADQKSACAAACEAAVNPLIQQGWSYLPGSGDCSASNFEVESFYAPACEAENMSGSLLATTVQIVFSDARNTLTSVATGAMAYDDSDCISGQPCEPWVLFTSSLSTMSFTFAPDDTAIHTISATGLELSMLRPVQATQDPASGLLRLDEIELDFHAAAATVDGVPVGPVHMREFIGPVSVTINPRSGVISLLGSAELLDGQLYLGITADPQSPTTWPAD